MNILISTCSQGLIYAILALGVYITFRILNFADMTAEGSLTLGGSVCAVLILSGMNPILGILIAGVAGAAAGFVTGILHTKLKIQAILSGILTMIALYSVNIRIMGKANLSLLGKNTVFKMMGDSLVSNFGIVLLVCVVTIAVLYWFFKTCLGMSIVATGDNEQMMRAQGANTDFNKILALMIGNALCAVSGGLIAQSQGYSDINMGVGTIVIALASIVMGEAIIKNSTLFLKLLSAAVGSVCYRFIIFFVLTLGMNPSDLKLFTAVVATALLSMSGIKEIVKRSVSNVKN